MSEKRGNRSAVATPIWAVAAWIWASAWRMSGRRRSSSDGTPTGTAGGPAGMSPRRRQLGQQGPRLAAEQDAQTVDGLLGGLLQGRDLGGGGRDLGLGVGYVQAADEAALESLAGQVGAVLLGLEVPLGDGDLLLEAAQVDVVESDLGGQRHQDIQAGVYGGFEVRGGGLDAPPRRRRRCPVPRRRPSRSDTGRRS